MANIKYADPSYTDTNATDDDRVMLRTGAGGDARAPLVQPKGYIDGLKMVWVSGTQIQVSAGAAYVPGPKRIAELSSAVTLTPSLAASTWYHVFLTVSGATVGVEAVTTAPAAPYTGTARAKTGDTSRRYIGSFRTMPSSAVAKFTHDLATAAVTYLEDINSAPFNVVSAGVATTPTAVSCSAVVPMTSKRAKFMANNNATNQAVYMSNTEALTSLSALNWMAFISPSSSFYSDFPLDSSQTFNYMYGGAPTGGQSFVRVAGYSYER